MNNNNELEKHLLTRSYDDDRIQELLETRYSLSGSQKPSLILLPTGTDEEKPKSLLHHETTKPDKSSLHARVNTRLDVRLYLQKTNANQKKLIRRLQSYRQSTTKKKMFPLMKLIQYYEIPKYEDFQPIHDLWISYIQNLVFPDVKSPEAKLPAKQSILAKLASAEYTGCNITVLDSRNANVVGLQGIVVYDTQYSFIICIPRHEGINNLPAKQIGGFRTIPKKFTLFSFDIQIPHNTNLIQQWLSFTLVGSRIEFRTVDRSTKKFKNHNVDDIL